MLWRTLAKIPGVLWRVSHPARILVTGSSSLSTEVSQIRLVKSLERKKDRSGQATFSPTVPLSITDLEKLRSNFFSQYA